MDGTAHTLANALVGNPAGEATLEVTVLGPELEFEQETLIALCGAEFDAGDVAVGVETEGGAGKGLLGGRGEGAAGAEITPKRYEVVTPFRRVLSIRHHEHGEQRRHDQKHRRICRRTHELQVEQQRARNRQQANEIAALEVDGHGCAARVN